MREGASNVGLVDDFAGSKDCLQIGFDRFNALSLSPPLK